MNHDALVIGMCHACSGKQADEASLRSNLLASHAPDRRYALVCPDGERLVEPSDLLFVLLHSRDKYEELSAYDGPSPARDWIRNDAEG